jgi:dipeptidyl aminopeptidase/acylaminoacyl peptidase
MPPIATLVESHTVTLRPAAAGIVEKLYDRSVLTDTVVERITYLSDGLQVKGYIARPKAEGRYPVIIWNRGGYGLRGSLEDLTAYLILASTAVWGYVLLATQYRGNHGGEGVEDWGGEDVRDAYNLIGLAETLPYCDTNRIAVEGASRGGMTTYRLLTMYDRFKCAIVHAGLADVDKLREEREDFCKLTDKLFGDLPVAERFEEVRRRSATQIAEQFSKSTPILLLHGTADTKVPISQSIALDKVLTKLGHPHELVTIKDGGHVSLKDGSYREIDGYRKKWLERYL